MEATYKNILVEVWSVNRKAWSRLRSFETRTQADAVVKAWERDGYKARVVETAYKIGTDFVNNRGE